MMNDWTSGYVSDIGYTFGYYNELNPLRADLALTFQGFAAPKISSACELGFGQGLSLNLNAASSDIKWMGNDFNPSQASFAMELASVLEGSVEISDKSFEELLDDEDLPGFDFIGLHGIWSWISDSNRAVITELLRKKLNLGGVVYVSYNTLPGWSGFAPMRHLMTQHSELLGADGQGIVSRIEGALEFAKALMQTEPQFSRTNPDIARRLEILDGQNKHYLAHEYFNRDWHPMHFATMADWLEPTKLEFACSAHLLDHVDTINLSRVQREFLAGITDRKFKESARDFVVNQQFRRDYWVRGLRRLSAIEKIEKVRELRVILAVHPSDVKLKVTGSLGEADLTETIYNPIVELLRSHEVLSIGDIENSIPKLTLLQIAQAILILTGAGYVFPCNDDEVASGRLDYARSLNQRICHKARTGGDISFLSSPVTGGGIGVSRFHQLFLLHLYNEGTVEPLSLANSAWEVLKLQGQKLIKDGVELLAEEENLKELESSANDFISKRLPALRALKII